VSNDLDASSRQGSDGLRDPLLQAVLHSCGPQQGEVCLYGLCLSCHCFFPPLQCHTGFMIAGAPHLHTLYGCDFCVIHAVKQSSSHDMWKADPSVDRNTRLHEARLICLQEIRTLLLVRAWPLVRFHVHEHLQALISTCCHHAMRVIINQCKNDPVAKT